MAPLAVPPHVRGGRIMFTAALLVPTVPAPLFSLAWLLAGCLVGLGAVVVMRRSGLRDEMTVA
jgi:hypothetical protein